MRGTGAGQDRAGTVLGPGRQGRVDGACVSMGSMTKDKREVACIHAMDTKNPIKGEP